jgi:hypothetical protein
VTVLSFPFQKVRVARSRLYPDRAKLVPFIPVALVGAAAQVPLMLIADSGSDYTIVSYEIAPLLGLDLEAGERTSFCGTSGEQQDAYVHRLDIVIENADNSVRYATDVAFASLPRSVAGLLGRVGFFDRFVVTFNQPKNQIILRSVV